MAASGPGDGRRPRRDLTTFPYGIEWSEPSSAYATKVGIVLRTRDRPLLLPRAVASIIDQTLEDWQLVIVNHAGDAAVVDRVLEVVADDVRKRIEVVHLEAGGGMERASNAGLRLLDSQYVAVHDDDDTWLPAFLERTTAFLDDPANTRYGAVVTQILKRWERVTDNGIEVIDEDLNSDDVFIDVQRLFGWNRFLPIGFLFRSALIDVIGPFNEHLDVIGDWDFHMRVAAVTDIGFVAQPLARYHLRDNRGDARYVNTITAGVERHLDTDARVRGALLRRYLDDDPSRLGLLVALSHDEEMARRRAERIEELVKLIDWRTHHTGNRINDIHDRVIRMEGELDLVRADVARLRRALSVVGAPLRPLRKARLAWRRRRA